MSLRKMIAMNKIVLKNENIVIADVSDSISYEFTDTDVLGVKLLNINILKSTDISLYYDFSDSKLEISINVLPSVSLNIYEKITGDLAKVRTKYFLNQDSNVYVSKFNDIESIKEYCIINLDGEGASISYNLKTISVSDENYDLLIYHNFKNTKSDIVTNGVCIKDGKINFNVSSFIPNGMSGSVASQNNKIINLTDNECIIKPNLYIDEYDIVANHSAWIGSFRDDELFYLQSRGINKDESIKLLIKGFLTSRLNVTDDEMDDLISTIDNYWR